MPTVVQPVRGSRNCYTFAPNGKREDLAGITRQEILLIKKLHT